MGESILKLDPIACLHGRMNSKPAAKNPPMRCMCD